MSLVLARAGSQGASIQINRPKFKDLWSAYPVNQDADTVYHLVGGDAENLHKSNPDAYANACALRLSRAFNYGGVIITAGVQAYKVKGGDGKLYIIRVLEMISFVTANFGSPDDSVSPQGSDVTSRFSGRQGILTFEISGWSDARGHVTLWDGTNCGDHCYFVSPRKGVTINKISYWELK